METARVFVGIPLPESCQTLVGDLTRRLGPLSRGPMSRTRPGNAHVTLKFLGDVPVDAPTGLAAIRTALGAIDFCSFPLTLAGGGFFPDVTRPRVIWAALAHGAGPCRTLAAAVEETLVPLGFPPEPRPFTAHLTLARLKAPGRGGDWPAMLNALTETVWPNVLVSAFALFRSTLSQAGPRYEVLDTFAARDASCGVLKIS
jgi:RNA 2',3'-cyclic 3'-phosphodiesterase